MSPWWFWYFLLPIAVGLIGASTLIVAKIPKANEVIGRLMPFKAFIGLGALVCGIITLFKSLGALGDMFSSLFGLAALGVMVSLILLGFVLSMPQIAKWIPGESDAEQKALEVQQKLVKFEVPLGLIAIVSALIFFIKMP